MIIRLWSSYNTSVSSDGWSWVGTQSVERLFELPQLFVRSPVEQTGLCNYLPRTSSTFQGPGTPGYFCGGISHVDKHLQGHNSYRALTVVLGQLRRETLRIFCVTRDLKESLSLPWEKSPANNRLLVRSTFCTKKINRLPCDLHHHSHTRVFLVAVRWSRRKRGEGGSGSVGSKVE